VAGGQSAVPGFQQICKRKIAQAWEVQKGVVADAPSPLRVGTAGFFFPSKFSNLL